MEEKVKSILEGGPNGFFFQLSSIILLALIFLVFLRIIKGPTVIDRLLCVNVIGKSIVILLLIGILFHRLDMLLILLVTDFQLYYVFHFKYYQHKRPFESQ